MVYRSETTQSGAPSIGTASLPRQTPSAYDTNAERIALSVGMHSSVSLLGALGAVSGSGLSKHPLSSLMEATSNRGLASGAPCADSLPAGPGATTAPTVAMTSTAYLKIVKPAAAPMRMMSP